MIKLEKILFNFTIVFIIIVLFSILLLNLNTFYWADDYNFMIVLKQTGILQNCINGYFGWDGRFLSIGAFVQSFFLKTFRIEFITFLWNLCFLVSGFLSFIIIKKQLNLKLSSKETFLLGSTTSIFVWFGSEIFLAQTVYWGTGGVYTFTLMYGLIWIIFYLKSQNTTFSLIHKIMFLFFTFFAGASSQNFSIGFVTLIIFDILIDFAKKDFKFLKFKFLILLILIFGILFLLVAPGNSIRMAAIYGLDLKSLKPIDLVYNFYGVFLVYYSTCKKLILMSVFAAIAFRVFCFNNFLNLSKINFKIINKKEYLIKFLENFKWLFVTLSTISPFIIMPMMASERTTIFFAFFLVIFIFNLILKNYQIPTVSFKFQKIVSFFILIFIISISFNFSIINLKKGIVLKEIMAEREQYLLNAENKNVTVQIVPNDLKSSCFLFTDFFPGIQQDHFIILGHKEYYNLKKITVIK